MKLPGKLLVEIAYPFIPIPLSVASIVIDVVPGINLVMFGGVLSSHLAYIIVFPVGVYDPPASPTLLPHVDDVYHPKNVYPSLVGVGKVTPI